MKLRNFRPDDSAALTLIFHAAVHALGREDYSPAQLEAWSLAPVPAEVFRTRVSDGRSVFVATDDKDRPIAFIELEKNGHIDCFYCHPDFAGTGVGTQLYNHLENAARAMELPRLFVEASEAARRFFTSRGFRIIARQDFERNAVPIHNYLMEKPLR